MKKRILFVNHNAGSGGAERSLTELANILSRKGFDICVALPSSGPICDFLSPDIRIEIFPFKSFRRSIFAGLPNLFYNYCFSISALRKIIKKNRVDIVHANSAIAQLLAGPAARSCNVSSIWHCRDMRKMGAEKFFLRFYSHHIIAVSQAVASFLKEKGFPEEKISVVYNGIEQNKEHTSLVKGSFRSVFGIPSDSFVALMVAHFASWKNHDIFIKAAELVLRKIPNAWFVIAGDDIYGNNPNYYMELKNLAASLNISEKIIFTGNILDIRPLLVDANCLVHPADHEPFGRIIIEAMAAGVPVIAADSGGPAEIIEHGKSGILMRSNDINAFADAIIEIAQNKQLAIKIAEEGKLRANNFNIASTADKIIQLYDSL